MATRTSNRRRNRHLTEPQTAPAAARLEDAIKVYGQNRTEIRALDRVSVEFRPGQLTAVMGASGSGKSTLLHCIAGLDALTGGRAFVGGTELGCLDDRSLTLSDEDDAGEIVAADSGGDPVEILGATDQRPARG